VAAIAAQDEAALRACFTAEAELQALVPHGLRERAGAAEAGAMIAAWFADSTELDVAASGAKEIADRLHVFWRVEGVEEGEPYVVEQQLYATLEDGRIARGQVLCSGFRPRH
jgi:hypothetical protein